ncbi:hypothetical protein GCM10008955_10900 [Deinococcus malanensis]|uniref:DUF6884 domain-containing protein n=1 Tax=Deinococcus malanensis TaxID=1706855 RepID=A0ABQ2ET37_9DEIO|nr:hypothetical protein GCM10008955_10900 [Deinococcus malanensis]
MRADEAYTGTPFIVNREYARRIGDEWVVLSAKYGFIAPAFLIPEPYEVTFNKRRTGPIAVEVLRQQVVAQDLLRFDRVIGLGGIEYRKVIELAFLDSAVELEFPFAGRPLGYALQATKQALPESANHHAVVSGQLRG